MLSCIFDIVVRSTYQVDASQVFGLSLEFPLIDEDFTLPATRNRQFAGRPVQCLYIYILVALQV